MCAVPDPSGQWIRAAGQIAAKEGSTRGLFPKPAEPRCSVGTNRSNRLFLLSQSHLLGGIRGVDIFFGRRNTASGTLSALDCRLHVQSLPKNAGRSAARKIACCLLLGLTCTSVPASLAAQTQQSDAEKRSGDTTAFTANVRSLSTSEMVLPPCRRGRAEGCLLPIRAIAPLSAAGLSPLPGTRESYHWKGLLLQSLAFQGLEHGPRLATADAADRHLLLNKPFWLDYRASLGQYNMRRWNDGDTFVVNYVGHPVQGAVSGYIQIQNDPRGRDLRFSSEPAYWHSRVRAFLWSTAYSTEFEIGPISEASIFNQGGYTYPLGCKSHDAACEKTAKYTNNTGWVDFIVTPVGGTLMVVAGDAIDRYVTDRLLASHPGSARYKILRGSLNPPRTLANLLRGRYPWYRDYDPPTDEGFLRGRSGAPSEVVPSVDLQVFMSTISLPASRMPCRGCRRSVTGPGAEIGVHASRFVDVVSTVRTLPSAGSLMPAKYGGSLLLAHFGLRTGFATQRFAGSLSVMPGFASYSQTESLQPGGPTARSFLFSAAGVVSGELRVARRISLRGSLEQIVVRYKSDKQDPPGIGEPPELSFLSHDNYINQTNWGVRFGPVVRF